jgi:hypothetical protein
MGEGEFPARKAGEVGARHVGRSFNGLAVPGMDSVTRSLYGISVGGLATRS